MPNATLKEHKPQSIAVAAIAISTILYSFVPVTFLTREDSNPFYFNGIAKLTLGVTAILVLIITKRRCINNLLPPPRSWMRVNTQL